MTVRLLRLGREYLGGQYRRTYLRLCRVLEDYTDGPTDPAIELATHLLDADDHGLLGWWLDGAGASDPPLQQFQRCHADAWAICAAQLKQT